MTLSEKTQVYHELGKLLRSGFHLDRSVDLLLGQNLRAGAQRFIVGLKEGLAQRQSLVTAVRERNGKLVTALELGLLDAGERSGRLAEACTHLSRYFQAWQKSVSQARAALVYPLLLLHMGIVVPIFAKHQVVGAMAQVLDKPSEQKLSMGMEMLQHVALCWLVLLLLWLAWSWATHAATTVPLVDGLLARLPVIGRARQHWALARFSQVFHSTLLAAMHMTECLRLSGQASQSACLEKGADLAANRVGQGVAVGPSLRDSRAFPQLFVNSIFTAEEAGGLDRELERWAASETETAEHIQARAAEWYPKALYFAVMLYVAWQIIRLADSYFRLLTV